MTKEAGAIEEQIARRMEQSASNIEASDGLLAGVYRRRRVLRRRRMSRRIATVTAPVVAVGAIGWAIGSSPGTDTVLTADTDITARSPGPAPGATSATELATCLQQAGLPVDVDGDQLVFVEPPTPIEAFETAYLECTAPRSNDTTLDESQRRAEALAEYHRLAQERAARIAQEETRTAADQTATSEAAPGTSGEAEPFESPESTTAPRRFVFEEQGDGIVVTNIIDRDGGVVTIELAADRFPDVVLGFNIVPGQFGQPPAEYNPTPIEVRGVTGVSVAPADNTRSLLWQEHRELAIELSATLAGDLAELPSTAELINITTRLVEVDETTWAAYREQHS